MKALVPDKRNSADSLENFARRIEERLRKGDTSIELLVCRLMTGDDVKVAASLAARWVEWRYGKPAQTVITEEREPHESGVNFFRTADTSATGKPN